MLTDVAVTIRRITQQDVRGAIALVKREAATNEWLDQIPEVLQAAVDSDNTESRACCAVEGADVLGIGVYGIIAGTVGTAHIAAILVAPEARGRGLGSGIARFIRDDLVALGSRLVIAELPDDPRVSDYRAILWGIGLKEESRIADYYRDAIPLLQMRLDL